jgi:hypothetical protein
VSELDLTLVGACGLYCGECEVYVAFTEGDFDKQEEIAESLSRQFNTEVDADQIICGGCHGPEEISFCAGCKIRLCATNHGHFTCADCDDRGSCKILGTFLSTDIGKTARRGLEEIAKVGFEEWLRWKSEG